MPARQFVPLSLIQPNGFTYNIPAGVTGTSAGVFNTATGQLIRTLWSNDIKNTGAGTHTAYWDGNDDDGNAQPIGNYTIKVLSHNISYVWEGVIGNSSTNATGDTVWLGWFPITSMVEVGDYIYCCSQYSENNTANTPQCKFMKASPQERIILNVPQLVTGQSTNLNCANGTNVFWAGYDFIIAQNFVFATAIATDELATFADGVPMTPEIGITYPSVIDLYSSGSTEVGSGLADICTGMAVQQSGNYLFVAHGGLNLVNVLNSTTGAFVRSVSMPGVTKIFLENDNTLWACLGTTVAKYTVNEDGTLSSAALTLTGFQRPAAISVYGGVVCITDGGINQYITTWNSSTGAPIGSLLQPGGQVSTPVISNDRIYTEDLRGITHYNDQTPILTYLCHCSDGSLWIGDTGNQRNLHYSSEGVYIEQISYLQHFYSACICMNQNTSVFAGTLEYAIDYTQPFGSCWTLVNNWGYNIPALINGFIMQPNTSFYRVILMSNNRRYALIFNNNNPKDAYFGELTPSGFRLSTKLPAGASLNADGSLNVASSSTVNGTIQYTISKYAPPTFDSENNPVYGSPTIYTSFNIGTNYPFIGSQYYQGNPTTSGKLIIYDQAGYRGRGVPEYHLAAWDIANNRWAWKAHKETWTGYEGIMPMDGSFDIGNGVTQPGGENRILNNDVFTNYHGEFWKGLETNYFYHFDESGLLVEMFGTNRIITGDTLSVANAAADASAGNVLGLQLTQVGDDYYIYHCDESVHGGLHRWHISNLASKAIQEISLTLTASTFTPPANNRVDLLAGNAELLPLVNGVNGWTRNPVTDITGTNAFTTLVRRQQHDLAKSPDIFVKSQNSTPTGVVNQSIVRALPARLQASLAAWTLEGKIDLNNNFQGDNDSPVLGTGTHFYYALKDINGKNLAIINFIAGPLELQFNNSTVFSFSGIQNNLLYQPAEFIIQKQGDNVYLLLKALGNIYTSVQAIFDDTADIGNPGSFGLYLQFGSSERGPEFCVLELFFSD